MRVVAEAAAQALLQGLIYCIEESGGAIQVDSVPEKGSCFRFQLELPRCEQQPAAPAARAAAPRPAGDGRPRRVLLAEDNPVNQMVARRMLERLGLQVDIASNGVAALAVLETVPYDAVFMDCQMPEMDGYQTTRAIRQGEPAGQHLPIIAMTANAMSGDRERCLAAGMDDYVSKPLRLEELQAAVARWLPST